MRFSSSLVFHFLYLINISTFSSSKEFASLYHYAKGGTMIIMKFLVRVKNMCSNTILNPYISYDWGFRNQLCTYDFTISFGLSRSTEERDR